MKFGGSTAGRRNRKCVGKLLRWLGSARYSQATRKLTTYLPSYMHSLITYMHCCIGETTRSGVDSRRLGFTGIFEALRRGAAPPLHVIVRAARTDAHHRLRLPSAKSGMALVTSSSLLGTT